MRPILDLEVLDRRLNAVSYFFPDLLWRSLPYVKQNRS